MFLSLRHFRTDWGLKEATLKCAWLVLTAWTNFTFTSCLSYQKFLNSRCIVLSKTMSKWSNRNIFSKYFQFLRHFVLEFVQCKQSIVYINIRRWQNKIWKLWDSKVTLLFFSEKSWKPNLKSQDESDFVHLWKESTMQCLLSCQKLQFVTRIRLNYWHFPPLIRCWYIFAKISMFTFHRLLSFHPNGAKGQ